MQPEVVEQIERWLKDYRYTGLGLPVPNDKSDYSVDDRTLQIFIRDFLVPTIKFLYKGVKSIPTFQTQAERVSYFMTLTEPYSVAEFAVCLDSLDRSKKWMYILPDLLPTVAFSEVKSELENNLCFAYSQFLRNNNTYVCTFGIEGRDVDTFVDGDTLKPMYNYPAYGMTYPIAWCVRPGGRKLKNLARSAYTVLTDSEVDFLRECVDNCVMSESDLLVTTVWMPVNGRIEEREVTALSEDKPPKEVLNAIGQMPASFTRQYKSDYHALWDLINDADSSLATPVVLDYFKSISDFVTEAKALDEDTVLSDTTDVVIPPMADPVEATDATEHHVVSWTEVLQYLHDHGIDVEHLNQLATKAAVKEARNTTDDKAVIQHLKQKGIVVNSIEELTTTRNVAEACTEYAKRNISDIIEEYCASAGVSFNCTVSQLIENINFQHTVTPMEVDYIPLSTLEELDANASIPVSSLIACAKSNNKVFGDTANIQAGYNEDVYQAGRYLLEETRKYIAIDNSIAHRMNLNNLVYSFLRLLMCGTNEEKKSAIAYIKEKITESPADCQILLTNTLQYLER